MAAIYKKELRSYFTSMTGYICMAFMLVVIGIYYAVINLASGYPYFGYTLSCVIVLFLLMTPVLTMRILAEEKSRKTDQLLLTAPVSLWKIVVGKYLAMVTVFGLALLVTCFYPLIRQSKDCAGSRYCCGSSQYYHFLCKIRLDGRFSGKSAGCL